MTETDGKARFTREFMGKLERLLGAEFRRDDFKLDSEGYVTSARQRPKMP